MSRFLGPIHHLMFNKILLQEQLTDSIREVAIQKGDLSEEFPTISEELQKPLEEIIDLTNIHNWLQSHINAAEERFARLVTLLSKEQGEIPSYVRETAYSFGREHGVSPDADAFGIYHQLDTSLLNGMPCDRVNEIEVEEEHRLVWNVISDVHSGAWITMGGDPANHVLLRGEVIKGMMDGTGFKLTVTDGTRFEIHK